MHSDNDFQSVVPDTVWPCYKRNVINFFGVKYFPAFSESREIKRVEKIKLYTFLYLYQNFWIHPLAGECIDRINLATIRTTKRITGIYWVSVFFCGFLLATTFFRIIFRIFFSFSFAPAQPDFENQPHRGQHIPRLWPTLLYIYTNIFIFYTSFCSCQYS